MARVAVLIDRAPEDPDWKGGAAWALINAMAESQHDVQVFTPLDLEKLTPPHPRVALARPAGTFHVKTLLSWARALAQYQPNVLHTFAPAEQTAWARLSAWPYLDSLAPALSRTARVATVFEPADLSPARPAAGWLRGHARLTAFGPGFETHYAGAVDVLAPGDVMPLPSGADATGDEILIPAPVTEWADVPRALSALAHHLAQDPARRARVVGGWGEGVPLAERRRAWTFLSDFGARVRLGPALSLAEYAREQRAAPGVWTDALTAGSWRRIVTEHLDPDRPRSGEAINALSRIYSTGGRW